MNDDFRTLFDLSPVAVYTIDAAGMVKQFNQNAARLWGRSPNPGDTDEMFCGSHRMFRPDGTFMAHRDCPMATVVHGDIPEARDAEVIIEREDGSRITVIVNIRPLKDAGGDIVGAINCFYDITERKLLEVKALQQSEDLIDLHRRKDEFLAMLSHELRGPLAPIFSAVQVLQSGDLDRSRQARLFEIIANQSRQLKLLVDDLMDVSRITHGKVALQRRQVSLASIIERAIDTSLPFIEQKRHEFLVTVSPVPMQLHADSGRIEQVIVNLLANAAKYTNAGGRISLWAGVEGGQAVLRVTDTGVGISPTLLPRIFDLFSQAERSIDRSEGGLGIGLCLVNQLIDLHGGGVVATSELGRGSEFTVRLPMLDGAGPSEPHPRAESWRDAGHRVLVVDDNVEAAQVLGALMQSSGFEVRFSHDGRSALEMVGAFRPHLLLLDIGLPLLDGYAVARAIRDDPLLEQPTLIAITGYSQDGDRYRSSAAGFDHHLVKPVDFEQLLTLISTTRLPALADRAILV
jgi:PAS domain S-box-containing protein